MKMCGAAFAETAETPKVIGILNYTHAVTDLQETVAFYKDVMGLELRRRPGDFTNPGAASLVNSPGVKLRVAMFEMPAAKLFAS